MKYFVYLCLLAFALSAFSADKPEKIGKIELVYKPTSEAPNAKITTAIDLVYKIFDAQRDRKTFRDAVMEIDDFTYTFENADSIAKWVFETDLKLQIRGYKGGDDTRTLAYVTSEYPNNIFINLSKLNERSNASVAATIVHELVHSVDRLKTDARFGHSGNSARGKQNSAPYRIGRTARLVITGDITPTKNKSRKQLLDLLNATPEEWVIEETEEIDESQVVR